MVHPRHNDLAHLVWYLFSEGKDDDHTDAHLVAAWEGSGELAGLEPSVGLGGRRDVRALVDMLAQPLHAARYRPRKTVWHCSIRNAPEDRLLTDVEWAEVARQVVDATGLAELGDADAVRWIAVRHSPNHIHLAATLVRQDGRTAWLDHDKMKARQRCYDLEIRYGLRRVRPIDRTGHRRPTGPELNKAERLGRVLPARDELRRRVRSTAAGSSTEAEFFARVSDAGVLVRRRMSVADPTVTTGYSVALPGYVNAVGEPVYFGGGKLARDLTLPKLRERWAVPDGRSLADEGHVRVSTLARNQALADAARAVRAAADGMRLAGPGGAAVSGIALAASDALTAVAASIEGRRGGPITTAAEWFDQAAREPNGGVARADQRSFDLRALSRLVHLMGRISGDETTATMLVLLLDLARLADTLASLRQAQQRLHQAVAARTAAEILAAMAATAGRLTNAPQLGVPDVAASATSVRSESLGAASTTDRTERRSR